jgi:hypothetical protein
MEAKSGTERLFNDIPDPVFCQFVRIERPWDRCPLLPGSAPNGACSDGVSFWLALYGGHSVARF